MLQNKCASCNAILVQQAQSKFSVFTEKDTGFYKLTSDV